jgi:signal transduction histidine kinase
MTSTSTGADRGRGNAEPWARTALARASATLAGSWSAIGRALARPDGPLAAALVLAGAALVEVNLYREGSGREVAILLNLCATGPLALAPRRVVLAAAAITAATVVVVSQPEPTYTVAGIIGQLAVAYLVARHRPRWVAALVALPFLVNAITPFASDEAGISGTLLVVLVVAAQVLGVVEGRRGAAVAERDAARLVMADSLREQAVMAERARIAHELHDIVAHHISMISVQAERARLTTPGMPEAGRTQLAAIGGTARGALDEMRRLLGVLGDGGDPTGAAAARVPQPGLDQVGELVDAARSAGTGVRLAVQGPSRPVPPSVDLAAYRIVQESLTNARRHAPGASVTVDIAYARDAVHVRVGDAGGPSPRDVPGQEVGGGLGLAGLAQRVALVGGTFHAGPADGGGFVVEAELPAPPGAGTAGMAEP